MCLGSRLYQHPLVHPEFATDYILSCEQVAVKVASRLSRMFSRIWVSGLSIAISFRNWSSSNVLAIIGGCRPEPVWDRWAASFGKGV